MLLHCHHGAPNALETCASYLVLGVHFSRTRMSHSTPVSHPHFPGPLVPRTRGVNTVLPGPRVIYSPGSGAFTKTETFVADLPFLTLRTRPSFYLYPGVPGQRRLVGLPRMRRDRLSTYTTNRNESKNVAQSLSVTLSPGATHALGLKPPALLVLDLITDRAELPYLNAVVKELARWYTPAPVGTTSALLRRFATHSLLT